MPSEKGQLRDQVTFKCTSQTIGKIDSYIGQGELTNRNEVIRAALEFFFENYNRSPSDKIKEWMISAEGEQFIKDLMRKANAKTK